MCFRKKVCFSVGVGVLLTGISGCSIGGSGGELSDVTAPDASDKVAISSENSQKVLALTVGGISRIPLTIPDIPDFNFAELFAASLVDYECEEGGKIELDDIDSSGGWVTFKNCKQKGVTINGEADVSVEGSRYSVAMDHIHIQDSKGEAMLERVFLDRNGNDFNANFVSASVNYDGYSAVLANYEVSRTGTTMQINGNLKSSCLGGWIGVHTNTPIYVVQNSCPDAGSLTVEGSGSSSMDIAFNTDGSLSTAVNGTPDRSYGSCHEVDALIQSCR